VSFSSKELKDGQEAYQRVKCYQIYIKDTQWIRIFIPFPIFGPLVLGGYTAGNFHEVTIYLAAAVLLLIGGIFLNRRQRKCYAEDTALLTKLRLNYGVAACDILRKEPSSWHYFLFQRRFPDFRKDLAKFSDPLSN
jgi:hypothetical protein